MLNFGAEVAQELAGDALCRYSGRRKIDFDPVLAGHLKHPIGNRTSGYLFCTESGKPLLYPNLVKNVLDPILYDRERDVMKREGKGWIKTGTETIPGVLGPKSEFQDKEQGRSGFGAHSFRRFRASHLDVEGAPHSFVTFWMGHGKKTITEEYQKAKQATAKRQEWAEKVGLGFNLSPVKSVTKITTKTKKENAA